MKECIIKLHMIENFIIIRIKFKLIEIVISFNNVCFNIKNKKKKKLKFLYGKHSF